MATPKMTPYLISAIKLLGGDVLVIQLGLAEPCEYAPFWDCGDEDLENI